MRSAVRANRVFRLLQLWCGTTLPVGRLAYVLSGFSLALLKYSIEAISLWGARGALLSPIAFILPSVDARIDVMGSPALQWSLIPFVWIALSMSIRRAADAGHSPWNGMLVLVPYVNLLFMLVMCLAPSAEAGKWHPKERTLDHSHSAKSATMAIAISLCGGGMMLGLCVYLLESYGSMLFLGTPLAMGASASYFHNRHYSRSAWASVGVGAGAVFFGAVALLLLALEGVICIAMALPVMLPMGILGGLIGKAIADSSSRPPIDLLGVAIVLPLLAIGENQLKQTPEYEVTTSIVIDAPPEVVWQYVVDFPELPPPEQWYFQLGVAYPERARIEGLGVGATRYCEFSTGAFVEPITDWDAPHRLAFDVTDQPAPMFELSPYRHVHPPHLHGYLRSNRGEFRLTELPGNQTLLEGHTWYEFDMHPQAYWTIWSDSIIHQIHRRVLWHIQELAEEANQSPEAN